MLNFIIGRKNSGKTTAAHKILGEAVEKGRKTLLLVPKQYTFDSDKSILSLLGPRKASEVEVLSFTRLCHIALQNYGGITKPIAKSTARLIYMSLALESLCDRLSVFRKHKQDIALVTKMLSFVDEMKNEGITADDLEKCTDGISDDMLKEKIRECVLIYRTYEALISESAFDDADLLSRVHDVLFSEDFFDGKVIVIDGFASFTHDELKLITLMLKRAENVYITLCLDEVNPKKQTGAFAFIENTARRLLLAAGNNAVEVGEAILCDFEKNYFKEDLAYLERNIYNPVFVPYQKESENVTVITASGFSDECDAVARQIKKLIRQGEYRCRDIAVVFRDDEKYEKQLRLSFKKYGVPFFEDKRQPTVNQPLVNFVRSLLLICAEGFDSDVVFRLIKTGLAHITTEEAARLENYTFMWDISGRKWLSDWTHNPDGFGEKMTEKREAELSELNAIRRKVIEPISAFREKTENMSSKQCIRALYEYLRENRIDEEVKNYALSLESEGFTDLAIEQEQVWDILMEAFDDLATVLGDSHTSMKRLSELFELVINEKTLGKLPDGFDEVSICTADRMLTKRAKVVFAVGLNQGLFPKTQSEEGIFSAFEKIKIEKSGLALGNDIKERRLRERFLLYNALSSASDKLFLSHCITSGAGEKSAKSEGITLTERILPRHKTLLTSEESLLDLVESEKSAFELMAESYRDSTRESDSLYAFFSSKEQYKARLDSIGRAVAKLPFEFESEERATELFGRDMYFSASQMEVYSKCPFMYFCKYGIGAKPRATARLDPAQSGTVIHYVLEMLMKKYEGKEFLRLSEEEMKEELSRFLKEYMDENMGGAEDKDARFNYLYSRLLKVLSATAERLCREFEDSDFEPCDFELAIKKDGDVKPFAVPLDEGSVQIRGIIDRVDKMDLDGKRYIRVVDYKTGGKTFELSDVLEGLNMQMLLYLISVWRKGEGFYKDIIPAGVLYFPAKMGAMSVDGRDEDEEIRKEKRFMLHKMNGMLVGDTDMAQRMEKSGKGLFIPVSTDKRSGRIKGKFIDLDTLRRLGERMDGIIKNMGDSLHKGKVQAMPVYGSDYTKTCEYCDYADVCLEENPEKRYIRKIPHEECLELLSNEEKAGEEQ